MKTIIISLKSIFPVLLFVTSLYCKGQEIKPDEKALRDTTVHYKDGSYEGLSRAIYSGEPYWGNVHFILRNGSFTEIKFMIRDSSLHETFDENYEKHFEGNPVYIDQCRKDRKGVLLYPGKLSETQNPDKIDAMSGATWSYNIFRASVNEALKNGRK